MANMNERDSKVHVTITHKREKKKPKYNFSVVMSGLLITSTLLASFSGLSAHAAGLDTDYASRISNPTPIVATYQREYSSNITSLLNTSYEELLLVSNKLNNDNATLNALVQINQSLNEANESMDRESYNPAEVVAMATMIRTALDGVETNLTQSGYDINSSQVALVGQMRTTIGEINSKAGNKLGASEQQAPVVKNVSFSNFNWNNKAQQFTDVPSDAWYYDAVSQASASGIINGSGNGKFNPSGTLTHAEAMTLMAKTHAIYHDKMDELSEAQGIQGEHWASGILEFCMDNKLPTPSVVNFDAPITRGTMARYFYYALPSAAYDIGISNDVSLMPENTTNSVVKALFRSGIMVGDSSGFRLNDSITRAEAAAIIQRVANPNARVEVASKPAPETPTQPQQPSTPQKPETPTQQVQPGQVQTDKPYTRIPHTNWQSDPTGGVTITSQSGAINTKYGNHTYGCNNQQEYDKVMSVIDEAYNYASQKESTRVYRGGDIKKFYVKGSFLKFYRDEVGLTNENDMMSMGITEQFVSDMSDYLRDTYAVPNGKGTNTDSQNNNVYKYLFGGGYLDCDGKAHLYMLCYDYLGFSTRTITSMNIKHSHAQVYVTGEWIVIDQNTGKLDNVTHSQLLELMSGIKNDAYEDDYGADCDAIVLNASTNPEKLSDLHIRANENPTHNPSDTSVR